MKKTKEQNFECSNLTGERSEEEVPLGEWEKQDLAEVELQSNRSFPQGAIETQWPFRPVLDEATSPGCPSSPLPPGTWPDPGRVCKVAPFNRGQCPEKYSEPSAVGTMSAHIIREAHTQCSSASITVIKFSQSLGFPDIVLDKIAIIVSLVSQTV